LQSQPFGGHLRRDRLVALSLGSGPYEQTRNPVLPVSEFGGLAAAERGRRDTARDADGDHLPVSRAVSRLVIRELVEGQLEQPGIVAAVVDVSASSGGNACRVGDLVGLDEVPTAQRYGVDAELPGDAVHLALDSVVAQAPPHDPYDTVR